VTNLHIVSGRLKSTTSHLRPRPDWALAQIYSRRGGGSRVAEHLHISRQAVSGWTRVPMRHAGKIADLFDMQLLVVRGQTLLIRKS
jgi:hypothetical protein